MTIPGNRGSTNCRMSSPSLLFGRYHPLQLAVPQTGDEGWPPPAAHAFCWSMIRVRL